MAILCHLGPACSTSWRASRSSMPVKGSPVWCWGRRCWAVTRWQGGHGGYCHHPKRVFGAGTSALVCAAAADPCNLQTHLCSLCCSALVCMKLHTTHVVGRCLHLWRTTCAAWPSCPRQAPMCQRSAPLSNLLHDHRAAFHPLCPPYACPVQLTRLVWRACSARLASKIKLTADLNDVHIALTPLQPWRTL